jgi:inosose dehydratase
MSHSISRRDLVAAGLALRALLPSRGQAAGKANITVGITVDTRPDWNGPQNFIRSIQEASEVGYHWIETFWPYVSRWENNPQGLRDELEKRNLKLETVSNGAPMRTDFVDPSQRAGVIEDHMKLVHFIKGFGCDHLKINLGGARTPGDEKVAYKEMSTTFNELGKRMTDLGMKFGVHAHLNSSFETPQDVEAIMERTDPKHVYFICDTGHVTLAGMDPVKLTRDYTSRIIEYHVKDVLPEHKGGYKGPPLGRLAARSGEGRGRGRGAQQAQPQVPASVQFRDRYFFEMGRGGVDFPAILQILNDASWKGWFTVELDSTITTAKGSCTVNKQYLEQVLKLKV